MEVWILFEDWGYSDERTVISVYRKEEDAYARQAEMRIPGNYSVSGPYTVQ